MAEAPTQTVINCPACQTPLTIPIRLEMTSTTEGTMTADMTAVRQHVDDHQAADTEHCIHDAAIHHRHHNPATAVDGCPWCEDAGTRVDEVPTGDAL